MSKMTKSGTRRGRKLKTPCKGRKTRNCKTAKKSCRVVKTKSARYKKKTYCRKRKTAHKKKPISFF